MIEEFLDEKGNWKCIKCGACCKNVKSLLPNLASADGSCKYLTKDNMCSIYEIRPEICKLSNWGDVSKMNQKYLAKLCDDVRSNYA